MRANGLTASANKHLVKEVNALRAQLKKVSEAMQDEQDQTSDEASRTLEAVGAKGKQAIDGLIEAAQNFIDEYGDTARDRMNLLAKKTGELREKATESLVETVEHRPLGTVAAIVGIGFLAGYLFRRP